MVLRSEALKYTAPFSNQPMIPPVKHRDEMKKHVEEIVVQLSFEVLKLDESGFPLKKQAYEKLVKKGFQNDEFLWLTQLAVDYCDYLIIGNKKPPEQVIPVGVKKVVELYLAQLFNKTKQTSTMLPGAQNYYNSLLKEYPELKREIEAYLLKQGNTLGAKQMSNYYGQPQVQPVQLQDGNWYYPDGRGGYIPAQMQQPTLTNQWDAVQSRRVQQHQQQYYQPQQVAMQQQGFQHQQGWGVNPAQPMSSPAPVQQGGGYAGYNPAAQQNQQQPNGSGFGPYTGGNPPAPQPVAQAQPAQHQPMHAQATTQQRHVDIAPPTTQGQKVQVPRPGTPEAREQNQAPVIVSPAASALMQTYTGYECEYFAAQQGVDGFKMDIPVLFDARHKKGIYVLNNKKSLLGFKTVNYQENDVDYNKHETSQFFAKIREQAAEPNQKKTNGILADIQRKLFIKETLDSVEYRKLEGNVKGDVGDVDLTSPVIIGNPIISNVATHDYITALLEVFPDVDIDKRVVNFEHYQVLTSALTGDLAVEAFKIRRCKDWFQLKEIIASMTLNGLSIQHWSLMNSILTKFVNELLEYRFQIDIKITSFDVDIDELMAMLYKEYDIRNDFNKCCAEICRTALFPHYLDDNEAYVFTDVHNFEIENGVKTIEDTVAKTELEAVKKREEQQSEQGDDTGYAEEEELKLVFIRLSDVTILPIESSVIYLPLPEQDSQWEGGLPVACAVTVESFPQLYNAIHDRVTNSNYRAAEVVFVTRDNIEMHVKKTHTPDVYIISRVA